MESRAIVKAERPANRAQPRVKFARHTIRAKEGTIYDPVLGVNVKVGPREPVSIRFALKVRSILRSAKEIWDVASEPLPTRTVKADEKDFFAPPSVKVERQAEL